MPLTLFNFKMTDSPKPVDSKPYQPSHLSIQIAEILKRKALGRRHVPNIVYKGTAFGKKRT